MLEDSGISLLSYPRCEMWSESHLALSGGNSGGARVHLLVDAGIALLDLEEASHAPWGAPWVSAQPVGEAALNTVTNNLDGVATGNTAGNVVVDTGLVVEEVLIDGESTFHGAVVVKLGLDGRDGGGVNDGAGLALVLGPGGSIGALLGGGASGGVARSGGVGKAALGHNTGVGEVLPSEVEVTTVTTVVVVVTRDEVLGGEDDVLTGLAESVWESLGGTESPAWTALSLISNGVNASLPGGVGSGVEVGGESGGGLHVELRSGLGLGHVGADEGKEVLSGLASEGVGLNGVSLPSSLRLDLSNELVSDGVSLGGSVVSGSEGNNGADDGKLEHRNKINNYYFIICSIHFSIIYCYLIIPPSEILHSAIFFTSC
jgi:hypothetical protein